MKTKYLLLILTLALIVVLTGCPSLVGDDGAGDGDGDDTSEETDTTAPAAVTAVDAAVTSGTVGLIWEDPADEDLDQIQISWEPGGSTPQPVAAGVGSFAATGLSNGQAYTFTIAAVDSSGNVSSAETVAATPESYNSLAGTISGTIDFDTGEHDGVEPETFPTITVNDIYGDVVQTDSTYDQDFSFTLAEPAADTLSTAAELSDQLTSSNPTALFQSAQITSNVEDAWIYGADPVIFGTTGSTQWRYAEYLYTDSVTYLGGELIDEIGAPISIENILLAPGWNRVLTTYDVASDSYTVTKAAPPAASVWGVEENPARAEVVDEIAGGDGVFTMADVDFTFSDYLEGQDDTVVYGGGTVQPGDDFYAFFSADGEIDFDGRRIAVRVNYQNAPADTDGLQADTIYTLFGTGDYTLTSVRIYVYIDASLEDPQQDPPGSSQVLMTSDTFDYSAVVGDLITVTGGSFTMGQTGNATLTTDPESGGTITLEWLQDIP